MSAVSWLQIEQGWRVVGAAGAPLGEVAQVEGDEQADIFDGLALSPTHGATLRYVPSEQVGEISPGEVRLTVAVADAGTLAPFEPAPAQTRWLPEQTTGSARLQRWLRGQDGLAGVRTTPLGHPDEEAAPPQRPAWFGPKRVGFGVRPQTWQGWLVVLGIAATVLLIVALVRR
jgi:hypothetical protein